MPGVRSLFLFLPLLLFPGPFSSPALSQPVRAGRPARASGLLRGGRILDVKLGRTFEGDLLFQRGRIVRMGTHLEAPEGVPVLDATGCVVAPGLVDAHSIALVLSRRAPGKARADVRDALDLFDRRAMESLLSRGVTTLAVAPPAATGVCGRMAVVKLLPGGPGRAVILKEEAGLFAGLGINLAGSPVARLKSARALEKRFTAARAYGEDWKEYRKKLEEYCKALAGKKKKKEPQGKEGEGKEEKKPRGTGKSERKERTGGKGGARWTGGLKVDEGKKEGEGGRPGGAEKKKEEKKGPEKPKRPAFDPDKEVLLRVLNGKMPLFLEVHRAADILWALGLRKRFGLDLVLVGCTEAYEVEEALAASGLPVILGPAIRPRREEANEFRGHRSDTVSRLARRGVEVILAGSGRSPAESRFLSFYAAAARQAGLSRTAAWRAVTLAPARVLGVADRVGSLEEGKDADFVLYRGDPLDSDARVEQVFVSGRRAWTRGEE